MWLSLQKSTMSVLVRFLWISLVLKKVFSFFKLQVMKIVFCQHDLSMSLLRYNKTNLKNGLIFVRWHGWFSQTWSHSYVARFRKNDIQILIILKLAVTKGNIDFCCTCTVFLNQHGMASFYGYPNWYPYAWWEKSSGEGIANLCTSGPNSCLIATMIICSGAP